jgi:hypothetical protein
MEQVHGIKSIEKFVFCTAETAASCSDETTSQESEIAQGSISGWEEFQVNN